jgi:hypothetical protein
VVAGVLVLTGRSVPAQPVPSNPGLQPPVAGATAKAPDRHFLSGFAGRLPAHEADNARIFFNRPAVRALLARLEGGGLPRGDVEGLLANSGTSLDQLVHVGLVRQDGARYGIGFAYFTAEDMTRIYAVADRLAPSLAAAYRARHADFDRIFARYQVPSVPRGQVAFVLLSGFCLNWDGLAVTRLDGYRRPVLVQGEGYAYSFWASETTESRDYHGVYWGSSTLPVAGADASFSSFGDPDSDPRMNLPDLLFMPAGDMAPAVRRAAERVGLRDEEAFGRRFEQVLGSGVGERVSAILFALRRTALTEADLDARIGAPVGPLLALLTEIRYLSREATGVYRITVPVFDRDDRGLVDDTIATSRAILGQWLAEHMPEIRQELSALTAARNGLSFEALFTQVWHEIFGLATRDLARLGVTADPYAADVAYKASFSALWRSSLYAFIPG